MFFVLQHSTDFRGHTKVKWPLGDTYNLTQKLYCQDSYSKRYFNLYLKYGFLPVSQLEVVSRLDAFEEENALFNLLL